MYKLGSIYCFHCHPQESLKSEQCSIYRSLVVNTSKEMMCFSDFPMPADYPNFPHNSELLQYFRLYAEHFDLLRYIRFQVNLHLLSFSVFSPIIQTTLLICVVSLCVCLCLCVWTHTFQTKVTSVTQRSDFSSSGQWDIVSVNKDQEEERHVFDAVMVCSGHYIKPTLPLSDFPGL